MLSKTILFRGLMFQIIAFETGMLINLAMVFITGRIILAELWPQISAQLLMIFSIYMMQKNHVNQSIILYVFLVGLATTLGAINFIFMLHLPIGFESTSFTFFTLISGLVTGAGIIALITSMLYREHHKE